jgi:hypothetical protein
MTVIDAHAHILTEAMIARVHQHEEGVAVGR